MNILFKRMLLVLEYIGGKRLLKLDIDIYAI